MWPCTESEARWLRAELTGYRVERSPEFPPELLDYYIRRGRGLQSEAAFAVFGRMLRALRRCLRPHETRRLVGEPRSASST